MRVLALVTTAEAEFFQQQVEVLRSQGVDVDVLAVPGERRTTDESTEPRSVWDYLRYYPRVLRASFGDYDLVHANYGLTGPAALAQPNLPVVLSLWGSDLMGDLAPVSRTCARLADATIVMSEGMAAAARTPVYVIPHGVDLDVFRPFSRAVAREVVGWRRDAAHVLFPYAQERDVKDYPRAERVVERTRSRLADRATATAAAGGRGGGRIEGDRVDVELRTLHDVPHARMPLYLNAADAVLMTSKREGSPNVVKEALACNTPVVSTDVGDVAERVAGVRNAFVADADDALVDALATVLERGEPSDGRATMTALSATRMGERIRGVYDDVLDRQ
jgi:glycosyltransferase involved in cell wall biosynthesis